MAKATSAQASKRGPTGLLKLYLITYNFASLAGWAYVLFLALAQIARESSYQNVFEATWPVLIVVQTTALFEVKYMQLYIMSEDIVHALLGWVRTPLMTTIMQVFSRIFLVWAVNYPFPEIHSHWSYTTMVISWSIAECVRYSYYATNLASSVPAIITWARYTFFLVLYPTGISSELIMIYQSLPYVKAAWGDLYYYIYIAVIILYAPGSPVMYNHMRIQRKKYLKGTDKKIN
ncbi:tyrosine phosphatase-like protein [Cokeromyces recurvatus]|uniref:tyrosine phosphatase-like protein n=1 Tax=Cokeromyces recurvatus TaxID=90255 RepID=UPI002221266D|nr:tyrosine phosphatase-like protein [Cokeromyces recurvatus]KAI7899655.1 tyrosine phosphatase-like protein [Cokeromyces recurvatus]